MNIIKILTLVSLTGTALMGGVFYAFGTAIMGSLQRMPTGQGAAAMNLINVRIQNPLFLLIFLGTALVCLALAVLAVVKDSPGRWWLVGGAALYVVGVMVISFAINIPLNDSLAAADPTTAAGHTEWVNYLAKWNPANNVRAISCTLAVVAFGLALHAGSTTSAAVAPSRSPQNAQPSLPAEP
ncbi:DUF1772 domain-containing protein [Micromonospora sp. DT228]|uniref:anthrone oxygenase family protein n=1 Tax=Micromonospora sp. DT228 TaxID=3393443 RepID=UPI003CEEEC9E